MDYTVEFNFDEFKFWSGAKGVIEFVKSKDKLDELRQLIENYFDGQIPNETEINDFVWFNAIELLNIND